MPLTPHPSPLHPSSAPHSRLGVCRMRGLHCACSQAPRQQGHLVPKQMLPSVGLLALPVCVSVCVCECVKGEWVFEYKNASSGRGQRPWLRGHLSNISAFHIKTYSVRPVCIRLSKDITDRETLCAASPVKLLSLSIWTNKAVDLIFYFSGICSFKRKKKCLKTLPMSCLS